MMLYDRIFEAMNRMVRRGVSPTWDEQNIGSLMLKAIVYEISNVVPLFDDWERDRGKPVPKRPPHPVTWCEWSEEQRHDGWPGFIRWRFGMLITEYGRDVLGRLEASKSPYAGPASSWQARVSDGDLIYTVQGFKLIEEDTTGKLDVGMPLHTPAVALPSNVFAFKQTGEYIGANMMMPDARVLKGLGDEDGQQFIRSLCLFGFSPLISIMEDKHDKHHCYWPPFMAFSLLHCKNVVAETHHPDEKTQRRAKRAGNPPRSSWKTIRIHVPVTVKSKQQSRPDDVAPPVRFHLCRGHFKNLQHPRYKNPGLHWWPAHWRGDPEAGIVLTERELTSS